jgi:hypothetical protein
VKSNDEGWPHNRIHHIKHNTMSQQHIKTFAVIFCTGIIIMACKKNQLTVSPYDYGDDKALFKINYACATALNPAVRLKINDVIVSNNITYATPFPGGGLNTGGGSTADYLQAEPGTNTIKLSIVKAGTNIDSIVMYETTVDLQPATYQTLHVADTGAAIQSVFLTDPGGMEDSGFVQYRFINLIPNSTGLDLYFGTQKMASNVAYKQVTESFKLAAGATGAWSLRTAGGTVALANPYTNTGTTSNQRVFTVYARGYLGLKDTDVRAQRVSLMYNK